MTLRKNLVQKALIGAIASMLVLAGFAGFGGQAMAQDTTTDDGTTTTDDGTTTTDDGTTTENTDTTGTTSTESTDTTTTDTTADAGQGSGIAAAFEETASPNPQPGSPAAPAEGAAPAAPAADQVLGESQLAFTGPDTRVAALALLLLGAGALTMIASRRYEERFSNSTGWVE